MKLALSILTSSSAFVVDLFLISVAIQRVLTPTFALTLIVTHLVTAASGAVAVQWNAPQVALRSRAWFFALCFSLTFFIPVLGVLGVQLVSVLGLTAKRAGGGDPWVTLKLDDEIEGERAKRVMVSASKIASILSLRTPEEAERRFKAILLVKHLPANQQVGILKLALKDASDEVRLFAFSRIEKFRADLEAKIKQFTSELEKADPRDMALLHLRLAESYHEIAYLQLAEGAVLDHALDEGRRHAMAAKGLSPTSGPAEYLLGRILLRKGEYDAATQAFQSAVRLHYPRTKVIPYLAECAFRKKRYDVVRSLLAEMGRVSRGSSVIQPLIDFWR